MIIKNPIANGWYADPEARKYGDKYYIYVTKSLPFEEQLNIDVFSSSDLESWEKHSDIIDMSGFPHVEKAVWAPTVVEKNGKYYLIFASNDIHADEEPGGLEIAVADRPEGPFKAFIDGSLIGEFHNGAQPIDAHLFKDDDDTVWLYYGGWAHCNVCRMNDDMTEIVAESLKEITPTDYTEAPCMIKDKGTYIFMWSSGDWTRGTYRINYAVTESPDDKIGEGTEILSTQLPIAEGPGHHGFLYVPESDRYLIVYHRRIPGDTDPHHRVLCMETMDINNGVIKPVTMTNEFEF